MACESLQRSQRRELAGHAYLGRILTAGFQIPEPQFQLWTALFNMEITQENYTPAKVAEKQAALGLIQGDVTTKKTARVQKFQTLHKLTASDQGLHPATEVEIEAAKRKLRRSRVRTRNT
jgi:hypothetical protein